MGKRRRHRGQPSAAWRPFSPPAGGAVISCTERTRTALSAELLGQGGRQNAAGLRPAPPFLERQPQGRGRASFHLSHPGIRSSLALPIAPHALPGLRPLGFFLTVLRAVHRQWTREALLGDRVLAPRADEPDWPGGDLSGIAGHTPHGGVRPNRRKFRPAHGSRRVPWRGRCRRVHGWSRSVGKPP